MAADWPRTSLESAGVTLIDCLHKTPPDAGRGFPYVAIPQMKAGRIDLEGVRRITVEHFREWTEKADPQPHDVVLSRRCNPGATAYVPPGLRFAVGQNLVLLRADGQRVYPPFLRWWVSNPYWWTEIGKFINVGAVFDSLRCRDVPKFEMPLPPIDKQRRIAAVLGALDDKIELNRKMNRTLEEMAQAIFKSWFADFDGHDDLVDSQIGPVPRGWAVRSLDEIADFMNGAACQKYPAAWPEPSLPVIKIRELNQGVTEQTDKATATIPEKWHVRDGDVLFSWSGSLVVKVWTGGPGALNQHLFKVTSDAYPRWFFLSWVQHHLAEFRRIAADKATTMGHIKRHHLTDAKCAVPPADMLAKVGSLLEPVVNRQFANELESRTLADLRDTLLPKLISGELRVPEADERVEAAVTTIRPTAEQRHA